MTGRSQEMLATMIPTSGESRKKMEGRLGCLCRANVCWARLGLALRLVVENNFAGFEWRFEPIKAPLIDSPLISTKYALST